MFHVQHLYVEDSSQSFQCNHTWIGKIGMKMEFLWEEELTESLLEHISTKFYADKSHS